MGVGLGEEWERGSISHADKPVCHVDEGEAGFFHTTREILVYVDGRGVGIAARQVFGVDFGFVRRDEGDELDAIVFQHMAQFVHLS